MKSRLRAARAVHFSLTFVRDALLVAATLVAQAGDNWPQWRGPEGNGLSDSKGLPVTWSSNQNVVWKTELPAWSGGTPIIWGDRIFLTSPSKVVTNAAAAAFRANPAPAPAQVQAQQAPPTQPPGPPGRGPGRRGPGGGGGRGFGGRGGFEGSYGVSNPGGPNLLLLCLSKKDGKVLWERKLDEGNRLWRKGNSSSPSPVTDGQHVWVVTGNGAVTAYDFEGREIWKRNLQKDYGNFGLNWGYASSPLLLEGKLIIQVLHGNNTDDPSYVVAFAAATGKELWRKERPTDAPRESPDAYTTPALLVHEGRKEVVVSGGDYVTGHDPETGAEVWRAGGLNPNKAGNYRIIASPVVKEGMIFAPTRQRPLLALRAGGKGDITTSHLAWKWEDDGGPDVPSPLSDGRNFYMVDDRGLVTCVDIKTGKAIWGPERTAVGTVSSSPLLADGKIYITNERAVTTVLQASGEFKPLATNELDGTYTLSSPAVSGSQLFVRTSTHLYCLGMIGR